MSFTLLDETDQRKCKNCGRVVFEDEITDSGCLICDDETTEEEKLIGVEV